MAMLWYGLYHLHPEKGFDHEVVQALITTHLLYSKRYNGRPLIDLWMDIYEPTVFYVGLSDDLGPDDFKKASNNVYGENPSISRFANTEKLEKVRVLLKDMFNEKTKIKHVYYSLGDRKDQSPRFMLMGQRYIPDSEVMQRLVHEPPLEVQRKLRKMGRPVRRAFPKGLDVMSVFGSRLAGELMLTKYKREWEYMFDYPKEIEKLSEEFGGLSESEWKRNLYFSWIWSLKSLIELSKEHKYPFFMTTTAWEGKSLNASLASWSQLRHHTILYGKQSFFGSECGGGSEDLWAWLPEPPKGYVEPNLEFYKRLIELLEMSKKGLKDRGLIDPAMENLFDRFHGSVSFLAEVARKELANEPRTVEEYEKIRLFGAEMDDLTRKIIPGESRKMQLIADVHTAYIFGTHKVLEEGTGFGNEIYVVVEDRGKLKLMRGAVLSYYEFKWPAADRLTDEKWLKMLKDGVEPAVPEWTDLFLSKEAAPKLRPVYVPKRHGFPFPRWDTKPGWRFLHYDYGC
jgi:hypothetical protein